MKNKNIIYILTLFLSIVVMSSCSEHEGTTYDQGNSVNAIFPASELSYNVEDNTDSTGLASLAVTVYRGNTKGSIDVPLTLSLPAGVTSTFALKDSVAHFQDGENKVDVILQFKFDELVAGSNVVEVALADTTQYPIFSASNSLTLSISPVFTFKPLSKGSFTSEFFEESWEQEIYVSNENANVYLLKDCYAKGVDIQFVMNDDRTAVVDFAKQPTGYVHPTYGMISVTYVDSEVVGKKVSFELKFTVSAGSFGNAVEEIEFP